MDQMAILAGIHEAIGHTPMVELSRLSEGLGGKILAKLEYLNPGFSKKDRAALRIIEQAEASGSLSRGQTIVELTSGNMGTGLALVSAVKGYPFVAVMSKGNSIERARMMQALGAEVVLVDQAPGSIPGQVSGEDLQLVEQVTQAIVRERNAFRADQFRRSQNVDAHQEGTALEIWQDTEGQFDAFVDFVGSGGTFTGCARAFKDRNANIRCYVVEPASAPYLAGKPVTNANHKIQGGGYSMDLPLLQKDLVDGYIQVSDADAIAAARALARREGIFAGFSSGANIAGALQLLRTVETGSTIVLLVNDSGLKYLSTDLYS